MVDLDLLSGKPRVVSLLDVILQSRDVAKKAVVAKGKQELAESYDS